jgi:copper(I)-binding protein
MNSAVCRSGWLVRCVLLACVMVVPQAGLTHGVRSGDLLLDHPYALPSTPDEPHGKAYLRGIQNKGSRADRLLGASTPLAAQVKLHRLTPDAQGFRGMQVDSIELPAKSTTLLRHTGDYQLSLIDLKQPLKDGDRFDLTLIFERAGTQTVRVWVQTPRAVPAGEHRH